MQGNKKEDLGLILQNLYCAMYVGVSIIGILFQDARASG